MNWSVKVVGEVDFVTDQDFISGGKNNVQLVDFETTSYPTSLQFEIIQFKMKIGNEEVAMWAPDNSEARKSIGNYYPVRFTAAKFPHDAWILVEITAEFRVRLPNPINSSWSQTFTASASEPVKPYNFGLNWQTTVATNGSAATGWASYPSQAQAAGSAQRTLVASMNHQVELGNPTNVNSAGILYPSGGLATFFFPNTHGELQGLTDSFNGFVTYADIFAARDAAVGAGIPKANMSVVMACNSALLPNGLKGILVGTEEFAHLGSEEYLYSKGYVYTLEDGLPVVAEDATDGISGLYIAVIELIKQGFFAGQLSSLAEEVSGITLAIGTPLTPEQIEEGNDQELTISSLRLSGDVRQRLFHVYLTQAEADELGANLNLWYLVRDPADLRGE